METAVEMVVEMPDGTASPAGGGRKPVVSATEGAAEEATEGTAVEATEVRVALPSRFKHTAVKQLSLVLTVTVW